MNGKCPRAYFLGQLSAIGEQNSVIFTTFDRRLSYFRSEKSKNPLLFRSLNRNFDSRLSYSRSEKSKYLCFFARLIVTLTTLTEK